MGLVIWTYLHSRVDIHSGTRNQYRSLQTPSRYPLIYLGRNARPGFHC
ncbi:unnamed protein product [Schistosoma mattheei]|uniref:Uncharacterized protein n=1 Tax=Schistosoma mattheei TaxID=31246 RepID=A0A3P8D2J6_9TREM|nr:unnamed protein product [Schistosoma mattheei]